MNQGKLYFDNASTTFPKPEAVPAAMADFIRHQGSNINRGTYSRLPSKYYESSGVSARRISTLLPLMLGIARIS